MADPAATADGEQVNSTPETDDEEQVSRLRRYDKRIEEWLASLKEEAGQRSPEVLGALAAKAHDVAHYLERMAEQARSKTTALDESPALPTAGAPAAERSEGPPTG